jgi:hypothetical protein
MCVLASAFIAVLPPSGKLTVNTAEFMSPHKWAGRIAARIDQRVESRLAVPDRSQAVTKGDLAIKSLSKEGI